MKVWSILALCTVLFFAVTYSSPTESEDQTIEQADDENDLAQEKTLRYLMDMELAEKQAAESQLIGTSKATTQLVRRYGRRGRRPRRFRRVRRSRSRDTLSRELADDLIRILGLG